MATATDPMTIVHMRAYSAPRSVRSAGTAITACSRPPTPSAAAPIASGPASGAKVAAVPVVPHNIDVMVIAPTPTSCPLFTCPLHQTVGKSSSLLKPVGTTFQPSDSHRTFEEQGKVCGGFVYVLCRNHLVQVFSQDVFDLFLVAAD